MLTNILPKGEPTEKLENALLKDLGFLYFVGHNARSFIYGFPMVDKTFHFIVSQPTSFEAGVEGRMHSVPGYQRDEGTIHELFVRWPDATIYIQAMPIDEYILSAAFAGDTVAMHVQSGRLICSPEYLTAAPTTIIREKSQFGLPPNALFSNEVAMENHRNSLLKFEDATKELAGQLNGLNKS